MHAAVGAHMLSPQFVLPLAHELVIDLFAGGGGASTGIEQAIGRHVDIAVNHDPAAVSLHQANHPQTRHFVSDVFEVDPLVVADGQPVGLLWASPDCKHFSKAKGGKPVSKRVRGLAWVVVKWAKLVQPRIICLENVEEFQTWGPLAADGRPCPERKGSTFARWKAQLVALGYTVEHRELRACDYGAPTIRKRLFLVARRDGCPIVWPEPTHCDPRLLDGTRDASRDERRRSAGPDGVGSASSRARNGAGLRQRVEDSAQGDRRGERTRLPSGVHYDEGAPHDADGASGRLAVGARVAGAGSADQPSGRQQDQQRDQQPRARLGSTEQRPCQGDRPVSGGQRLAERLREAVAGTGAGGAQHEGGRGPNGGDRAADGGQRGLHAAPAGGNRPKLKPWLTAASCIDWTLPCPSIFERERPLADATLRRIAHGVMRYVVNSPALVLQIVQMEREKESARLWPVA